jgi:hypothetical protein
VCTAKCREVVCVYCEGRGGLVFGDVGGGGVMGTFVRVVRVCVCVCVLHSVQRHCVCTVQCRVGRPGEGG